jgi:hypothetical protein
VTIGTLPHSYLDFENSTLNLVLPEGMSLDEYRRWAKLRRFDWAIWRAEQTIDVYPIVIGIIDSRRLADGSGGWRGEYWVCMREIAEELTGRGMPADRGDHWSGLDVHALLKNLE